MRNEGLARELINRIQNLRKDNGLEITDRINVFISPDTRIEASVGEYSDYIRTQVLADGIILAPNDGAEFDLDDLKANIKVEKV